MTAQDSQDESGERDLSKWYTVECTCGWESEFSSVGEAEMEAMSHQDHSRGMSHAVEIRRQSDGKKVGP